MMVSDEVVAVFPSKFEKGDVRVVYCPHNWIYELRYAVLLRSQAGGRRRLVWSAVAFDACDYAQVAHMLVDARALADTSLLERC
jgi:hypothetical protein|nr:MAG TPA: hypothetical protein [Caudoviricetes sp.]